MGKMDNASAELEIHIPKWNVTLQYLADILITAVESGDDGIGYWCDILSYTHTEGPEHTRAVILDSEDEDALEQVITIEVIRVGLERCIKSNTTRADYYQHIVESTIEDDASMIDSTCADIIVQFGLLGEALYG